jgi:hypothetical protein
MIEYIEKHPEIDFNKLTIVFSRTAMFLRNSGEVKEVKKLSVICIKMMMSTILRDNKTKSSVIKK